MAIFQEFLGKSKRLPLGLYEIYPEFFEIKEEKDTQGEGHAIILKGDAPPITGQEVAQYDPSSGKVSTQKAKDPDEERETARPKYIGESTAEYNQYLIKHFLKDFPDIQTVAQLKRYVSVVPDLHKMTPIPRPAGEAASSSSVQGVPRPKGPGKPGGY